MEPVEPDDDAPPFREPPPPDDRLWRHPSEVVVGAPTAPPGRSPRPVWAVAGLSALIASLVSSGLVVAVVSSRSPAASNLGVERQMVRPRSVSTVLSSPVVDIAERLRPAIVQLTVVPGGRASTGSGVMFRSDGYLLTNAHVVEGATSIQVSTASGMQLPGRLVGTDAETDTAVVKLDGGPFAIATLGSGADLRVGQPAIAIGFPLGLAGGPSVTGGMVSALHRDIRPVGATTTLVDMIQTDAPVSPGSSGGALLDANGAVVGITTAVASSEPGSEALGFATTIDVARSVADELIRSGRVVHVWLGVEGGDVDGATATDLDVDGGAMVGHVTSASPAERGGLATRDVIVAVNGRAVRSMGELIVALRAYGPGDRVALEVIRDRQHRTITVTLAERPASS
ncbi:MAG: peptidase S1 [Acidimicrobiales bacterium]|nr:MAG: peptidase S1 [Acidimicrobiales bacterium]